MRTLLVAVLVLLVAPATARAQTIYGMDLNLIVHETTGPSDPSLCNYPNGPILNSWPAPVASIPCPVPVFLPDPLMGDVAVNRITDTVFAADDAHIAEYTPAGVPLNGFTVPAPMVPLMGMGCNAVAGTLWISSGPLIAEILPPPQPCPGLPAKIVSGPFLVPPPLGLVTDVSYDVNTNTLWVCDAGGFVFQLDTFGAPLVGPVFPSFWPAGPLVGLALDPATPGLLNPVQAAYVTDGMQVLYMDLYSGTPAPPTFYAPATVWPAQFGTVGLAASSHAITYGATPDTETISMTGQATVGTNVVLHLDNAMPFTDAYLLLNVNVFPFPGFLCPPASLGFPGRPIYVDLNPFGAQYVGVVPPTGSLSVPATFLPTDPPGGAFYAQFVIDTTPGVPGGPYRVSEALELTLGVP